MVINVNFESTMLGHDIDVTVILPNEIGYDEKLCCMWLYHGGSGDHVDWMYHVRLTEIADEHHMAFVLPTVHESCFVDMNIGNKYGSYVSLELPAAIYNMFRCISDRREDNYIAGFSNGGYGCLHTALMHPNMYSHVGAFSAGDKANADFPNDGGAKSLARIRLYGDGDLHYNEYGLTYLADRLIKEHRQSPRIYHACGNLDPWLDMNHIVRDYFKKHSDYYDYTYDEIEGLGHEWDFWEEELKRFINWIKQD